MTLLTPQFLQTKTYSALADRIALMAGGSVQAGAYGAGDLKVAQRGAGANMSVDVAAGTSLVAASNAGNSGLYVVGNDATINVTVPASHATNPRIDQVVLHVYDTTHGGDATDTPAIEVIQGTATAGATLDNRTGAAALPANSLRLSDLLVPAASSTVTTPNIRDRRQWARGAFHKSHRVGGDIQITTNVFGSLDAANYTRRIETGGGPLRITFSPTTYGANAPYEYVPVIDGSSPNQARHAITPNNDADARTFVWLFDNIAAGSHVIDMQWRSVNNGTAVLCMFSQFLIPMVIEEILRPNVYNS